MIKFKCTECACDVVDTKNRVEQEELIKFLSPWISMCTECELKFFQSKKLGASNEIANRPQSNQTN